MDPAEYQQLWDYSYWARDKLLSAARGMTEDEYAADTGFVYPSVRSLMTHLLGSESIWLSRWRGEEPRRIPPDEVPTLEALTARWSDVEGRMRDFVTGLTPATLAGDVEVRSRERSYSLRDTMTMLLFHGAQHRSEAAEALSHVDRSPGELDLLLYLTEKGL